MRVSIYYDFTDWVIFFHINFRRNENFVFISFFKEGGMVNSDFIDLALLDCEIEIRREIG